VWARLDPPANRPIDVVSLGENSLDFVAVMEPGHAVAAKRRLRRFDLFSGGQTATAAVACARLGLKARYIGAFGDDDWGARGRRSLEQEGVDLVAISHPRCPSRIAVVIVDERPLLRSSSTMCPSRTSTRRGHCAAIDRSCVITMIVLPSACSWCSSSRMSVLVAETLRDADRPPS